MNFRALFLSRRSIKSLSTKLNLKPPPPLLSPSPPPPPAKHFSRTLATTSFLGHLHLLHHQSSTRTLHTSQESNSIVPVDFDPQRDAAEEDSEDLDSEWESYEEDSEDLDSERESSESDSEDDDPNTDEFLSRFVYIMRGKLVEAFPDSDKLTVDKMLLAVVEKLESKIEEDGIDEMMANGWNKDPQSSVVDFSEDLWKVVWEVCNMVLEDMKKAERKEKMKVFLQNEEVKEMARFAGEIGVRGDMLRELRFKWAKEKMEKSDFYEGFRKLRDEERIDQEIAAMEDADMSEGSENESENESEYESENESENESEYESENESENENEEVLSLPSKIKYKIYGLDLKGAKWSEVADKIHDMGEVAWPQEPKEISGKAKMIMEKILLLKEDADPASFLAEWKELVQPSRIDWISLLDQLREKNAGLYFKAAEIVLGEDSYKTNVRDYSKLVEGHVRNNRAEDAERILKKMNDNGVAPDIITYIGMVHMYSKTGNLDRAKEAFEALKNLGFQPDMKVYTSMIMAYVNAGQPKLGESLMREMETRDVKPTREIYMVLLRAFAERGHTDGAERIEASMHFAGFQKSLESCALLIEAWGKAGDSSRTRNYFDLLIRSGFKPDDRCTAVMIAAYERNNQLEKALDLLMELEKNGFQPGVATYSALLDWLAKCQLIDEVENLLEQMAVLGEAPPFKIHVSLCDMYSRIGVEKKALQSLGVLEAKKEQLSAEEFERVINGLLAGGFNQEARKMQELMIARGFTPSPMLGPVPMGSRLFGRTMR